MQKIIDRFWAILPAAGIGKRMGEKIPKQYLQLHGKTVLEHTLQCLLSYPLIEKIVVVVAENDTHWPSIRYALPKDQIITAIGGIERSQSVLNGLFALSREAGDEDWVLVHDAVRPCLQHQDLDRLISELTDHPVGGLLGLPVRDTLKYTDETGQIIKTIDRANIWQAKTPQMFRYERLIRAMQHTIETEQFMTDEAGAIELMGYKPKMIVGRPDNIKITHPEDLAWVERYWQPISEEVS